MTFKINMAGVSSMFILLCSCLFVNSEQNVKFDSPTENRDSEIAAVLHHLNSSPFKVYNYKSATVVHAHTKADITEIVLDVSVECLNNYPDLPCTEKSLTCRGFIQGGNQVLNDVDCKPKPEIIVDEIPTSFPDSNDTKIVLSHETASSEITEPFIAVRKDKAPCLGCPFDINPNADGVDELVDLALEHVESERTHKHGLVKVIRLQQQVVAGIKYVLTLEVRPTVCLKEHQSESCPLDFDANSAVCEVTYIQKPWLSKAKHIIANNCTTSQEYVQFDGKKTEMSNEININDKPTPAFAPNFDQIAMDGSRLSDLESQIIGIDEGAPRRTVALEEVVPPTVARLETNPTPTELTSADLEVVPSLSEIDTESTLSEAPTTQIGPDSIRKRRAIPQLEKISPEEKPLVKNLADFAAAALDNIDDDNHKRVILQILGAKKMVGDDGVYYHLIMRMGISHCLEDTSNPYDNCREKLLENYTKICKVQVYVNDDYGSPKVVKSQCQNIKRDKNDNNRTNYSRYRRNVPGGQKEVSVDSDEIRSLLKLGVQHLGQLRDGNRLKPVEVVSATTQVVAGKLTRINVKMSSSDCPKDDSRELEECKVSSEATPKPCQIQIWEKEWMNFRKFTIKCEDEEKEYEIETKIRNKRQAELTLKGGQKKISSDSPEVRKLAHEGIAHYNAQRGGNKFKPVEIVSATSQVVAGSLMRIETKVSETECGQNDDKQLEDCQVSSGATPKNCHVEVWEKLWENFRKFTIKCEGEEQEYNVETKPKTKTKRQTLGAEKEIAVESEQIRNLVNEGVTHYNTKRGGNKFKPVEIVSATSQVVAGTLLRIKTKVSETECGQTDDKELEDCQVSSGATPKNCSVEVWEKLWENFRKFTIKCEGEEQEYNVETKPKTKTKRQTLGAEKEIAVESEQIRSLVNEGVTHYNTKRGGNKFKPVEIVSATSQVVAGTLLRIKMKVSETECGQTDDKELEDCQVSSGATPKNCSVEVWEKLWENFRKFTIKCEGEEQEYNIETKPKTKTKRQAVGAEKEIAVESEQIRNLVNEGVTHYNTQRGGNKFKPVEIVSATSQVVAGTLLRIKTKVSETECGQTDDKELEDCQVSSGATPKNCSVEIWEKLWENFRKFTIKCEGEEQEYNIETKPKTKSKRHVGAEEEVAVKSEQIRNLVNEGITYYNIQRGGNKFVPVEIVSATSQVTGGKTFRINANIALSECKEHDRRELQDCPAFEGVVTRKCRINVQEVAWKNLRKFEIKCEGGKRKYKVETKMNNFLGGSEVASSDEHLEELLERALSNLDAESKHDTKYKVQEVLSASKQIVSGHIYRIKAKIVLSDCKKTAFTPRRQCGQLESSQPKTCDFVAFEKKWDPGSRELNITCENEVHTFKKGFLGANDNKVFYSLFTDFVEKYNKNYSPEEFTYRLKVFSDNMLKIRVLNTYEQGTATYGITKFADLTQKEFSRSLGYRPELRDKNAPPFAKAKIPEIAMPVEFDWRTKGAVTEVKNQQQCGSCWAFSVTGNIEGQYAISHGNLLEFSEQELVDCDTEDQGCNGGLMDTAYRQIEKLGGLETEQDYPYDAEDEKCHFNRTLAQVQLSGAVNISQDEGEMAKWLVANGPISIAINANAMQFYYGGVSHPFKFLCNPKNLDHGVLIVGYGVHTYPLFNKTLPYWTVKNSWGTSWGEQGYYRVFRGDGTCGLNQTPSSAIVV